MTSSGAGHPPGKGQCSKCHKMYDIFERDLKIASIMQSSFEGANKLCLSCYDEALSLKKEMDEMISSLKKDGLL